MTRDLIISGLILLIPAVVLAQNGLVPCSGTDCQACHFVSFGQNILRFLVTISIFIAGITFAVAGIKFAISAGNEAQVSRAKEMLTNALVGIIIVLAAWLIIDTVMKALTSNNFGKFGPWNEIQCVVQSTPTQVVTTPDGKVVVIKPGADEAAVRKQLADMGYTVNKGGCGDSRYQDVAGGCTSVGGFTTNMMSSLSAMNTACPNCGFTITGGSEAGHQTHDDGNSVDLRFGSTVDNFISTGGAKSSGLNCVREFNPNHWHCRR